MRSSASIVFSVLVKVIEIESLTAGPVEISGMRFAKPKDVTEISALDGLEENVTTVELY